MGSHEPHFSPRSGTRSYLDTPLKAAEVAKEKHSLARSVVIKGLQGPACSALPLLLLFLFYFFVVVLWQQNNLLAQRARGSLTVMNIHRWLGEMPLSNLALSLSKLELGS